MILEKLFSWIIYLLSNGLIICALQLEVKVKKYNTLLHKNAKIKTLINLLLID